MNSVFGVTNCGPSFNTPPQIRGAAIFFFDKMDKYSDVNFRVQSLLLLADKIFPVS